MFIAILKHHCCQLYIRSSAVMYKTILIVNHRSMKIYLPKLKMSLNSNTFELVEEEKRPILGLAKLFK